MTENQYSRMIDIMPLKGCKLTAKYVKNKSVIYQKKEDPAS